ncbi:MAG TPA: hypothetical protein VFZ21_20710, partial [Gemmatimonadaceae bacterium]|nr:hypothetical protein [Gemmatimonadaceae bacterium]
MRPARRRGCVPSLLAFGFLFALVIGSHYLAVEIDKRRFPWGYANSGHPPLVGTWVGAFTTGSGKRLAMMVDIELVELGRDRRYTPIIRTHRHSWLEGRVRVCDGPGRVRHLEASGEPNDNRATRFHLATSPMDTVQTDGLAPSHLYGRWDGGDSLAFEASLYLRRGASAISQSDDPDTGLKKTPLTLRRGTEATFTSSCSRL